MRIIYISIIFSIFALASGESLEKENTTPQISTEVEHVSKANSTNDKGHEENISNAFSLIHELTDLLKQTSERLSHFILGGDNDFKVHEENDKLAAHSRNKRDLDIFQQLAVYVNSLPIPRFIKVIILPVLRLFHNIWKFVKHHKLFVLDEGIEFVDLALGVI